MRLTITRSESFNYHVSYTPNKAHDGDYNTWYSVKDGEVAGNFLKLYLSETYSIGLVIMVSRGMSSAKMVERMVNTEVRVYSTEGEETELASCGTITGNFLDKLPNVLTERQVVVVRPTLNQASQNLISNSSVEIQTVFK